MRLRAPEPQNKRMELMKPPSPRHKGWAWPPFGGHRALRSSSVVFGDSGQTKNQLVSRRDHAKTAAGRGRTSAPVPLVAAMILIEAGCATISQPVRTYAGPELPARAVALIDGVLPQPSDRPQRLDTGGVYIPCINGVSLERHFGTYDNGGRWPNKLSLMPGRHYLAVVYDFPRGQKASWANVALDVEAGRQYIVKREVKGESVRMWVEDTANGMVVAAATPMRTDGPKRDAVKPCP